MIKNHPWRQLGAALLTAFVASLPGIGAAAEPVPVEAFFKTANLRAPALSPSGRWLALLTSIPGRRVGFRMIDLEGKDVPRFIEASAEVDVAWFDWVSDDWLVFGVVDPDNRSNERNNTGVMSVKRDGSESRMLIQRRWTVDDANLVRRKFLPPNFQYLGLGKPGSNDIIVGEWQIGVDYEFTHVLLKVLNVADGDLRPLIADQPKAVNVLLDSRGQARVLVDSRDGQTTMYWSETGQAPWRQFNKEPSLDVKYWPAYIDKQNQLVVSSAQGNRGGLWRIDLATGQTVGDPLVTTPGFNGNVTAVSDRTSGEILGLDVLVDAHTPLWFNPTMKRVQAEVDAKLPGRINQLTCRPCDNPKVVLVESYSDHQPGEYFIYRPAEDRWLLIGQRRPDIDPRRMASLEMHRTKTRDGLDMPVWVTRPVGDSGKPGPAVVLVHGGPHTRGTEWDWKAEAQFLASRGYVVIEPEFRGSTGYGHDYFRAGWKQWGLAMQDDVTDALKFAVDKGWVDAGRVCIMGGSYGGYAALMGLAKTPDQYRCGVAFAAVADPRFLFSMHWSDASDESRKYSMKQLVGDPKTDDARFSATSPIDQVARIKAPLLLAHGGIDRRVPIQNGERMRDALQKAGKSVDWVVYSGEGHGFYRDEDRIDFYRRVEAFLAKNLKP